MTLRIQAQPHCSVKPMAVLDSNLVVEHDGSSTVDGDRAVPERNTIRPVAIRKPSTQPSQSCFRSANVVTECKGMLHKLHQGQ